MIALRNNKSIQFLEDFLLSNPVDGASLRNTDPQFVDRYTESIFGNEAKQLRFELCQPANADELNDDEWHQLCDKFEEQFETTDLSDDQIVAYFFDKGLDFKSEYGHPLRCTLMLARSAEAAFKGIAGTWPSGSEYRMESWQESLATDATDFLRKKKRN